MALTHAKGKVLDIGRGANNFVRSWGNGVGVDVVPWSGCDVVIEDAANLPFRDGTYDTVSYLACLNHISNPNKSVKEAYRVTAPGGRVIVTMISPRWGRFIHWWRRKHDPDQWMRHIDHDHELLGMSPHFVIQLLADAGFTNIDRKRFVFTLNSLYIAEKPQRPVPELTSTTQQSHR